VDPAEEERGKVYQIWLLRFPEDSLEFGRRLVVPAQQRETASSTSSSVDALALSSPSVNGTKREPRRVAALLYSAWRTVSCLSR
jgi:hypothetical protein